MISRAELARLAHSLGGVTLLTYALDEILIGKLCALMGRTEPRDLYDVYWLFQWSDAGFSFLPSNFAPKCQHKGQDPSQLDEVLRGKVATFDKLWASRLAVQVPDLPHLSEVIRVVRRHFRGLGLG